MGCNHGAAEEGSQQPYLLRKNAQRIETTFQIWGYPGLAILLFLAAAGAGVVLLVNILFYDKSEKD